MVAALTAQCAVYGNRDAFTGVPVVVTRPDGSQFMQSTPATYLKTTLPPVMPIDGRSSRHEGTPRKFASGGMKNTFMRTARESLNRASQVHEVSRGVSESGLMWLVVMQSAGGRTVTINRLRSHREGRGGPWVYLPS